MMDYIFKKKMTQADYEKLVTHMVIPLKTFLRSIPLMPLFYRLA